MHLAQRCGNRTSNSLDRYILDGVRYHWHTPGGELVISLSKLIFSVETANKLAVDRVRSSELQCLGLSLRAVSPSPKTCYCA